MSKCYTASAFQHCSAVPLRNLNVVHLQHFSSKALCRHATTGLRHCNAAQSRYRNATVQLFRVTCMKKSKDASELAARIAAAASKPAGASSVLPPVPPPIPPVIAAAREPSPPVTRSKAKAAKTKQPDTVPITLRPTNALLNRYVLKAAERTREEGRVVSAQEVILEKLEQSDV